MSKKRSAGFCRHRRERLSLALWSLALLLGPLLSMRAMAFTSVPSPDAVPSPSIGQFTYGYYGLGGTYHANSLAYELYCQECWTHTKVSYEHIVTPANLRQSLYITNGLAAPIANDVLWIYEFSVDARDLMQYFDSLYSSKPENYIDTRFTMGIQMDTPDFAMRMMYFISNNKGGDVQDGQYRGFAISYSYRL